MAVTPIILEQRFPVGLDVSIPSIRQLYDESKDGAWNPRRDIDWSAFDASQYSADTLAAARLAWSRRAWVLYTGLAETPSVLVRFCLERGREADPKLFLTIRNTEEAWHIECCHKIAELCGGYIDTPTNENYAQMLSQNFHREVLHADTPLDAYFVAHCFLAEGIELALWQAYLANATDPTARAVLEHSVKDKLRHARFGVLYLEERLASWDEATRATIAQYVNNYIEQIELKGYQCASLSIDAADIQQADSVTAAAGLGALDSVQERAVFEQSLQRLTDQLRANDLSIAQLNSR